jgi:hypothetical protein
VNRGVAEDRGVVDPTGERPNCFRCACRLGREFLVTRVPRDSCDAWMLVRPPQRIGVEVDDDYVAVRCETLHQRSADSPPAAGHDVLPHHSPAIVITRAGKQPPTGITSG